MHSGFTSLCALIFKNTNLTKLQLGVLLQELLLFINRHTYPDQKITAKPSKINFINWSRSIIYQMKINKLGKLTKGFADSGADSFSGARNNSHLILVPHCKQSSFQYNFILWRLCQWRKWFTVKTGTIVNSVRHKNCPWTFYDINEFAVSRMVVLR